MGKFDYPSPAQMSAIFFPSGSHFFLPQLVILLFLLERQCLVYKEKEKKTQKGAAGKLDRILRAAAPSVVILCLSPDCYS